MNYEEKNSEIKTMNRLRILKIILKSHKNHFKIATADRYIFYIECYYL